MCEYFKPALSPLCSISRGWRYGVRSVLPQDMQREGSTIEIGAAGLFFAPFGLPCFALLLLVFAFFVCVAMFSPFYK
jgi:hypothetical protein